ncbi:MAG: DUF4139 domain-containing protein [Chitinispirillia bacterium]|nr:DUF4139 domain-containing protein [Chitinispirillia bacterium]MCL2269431.1 DUF4139 domain-containing protein [Chitinispirillia bacterium]
MVNTVKIALTVIIAAAGAVLAQGQAKAPPPAPHKTTADDRQAVEVTIYNRDLGLVKDRRKVSVPAGRGVLQFMDVADRINPVTVHIKPLSNAADFSVLEQNYEYDLISHHKLMEKYVGKDIKLIDRSEYQDHQRTVNATLLSMNDGEVYKIDKEIYLGHPGIKVLSEIPGNLISRPTLSWTYTNKTARDYQLEVSYLTGGMNWNADYVLLVPDDSKSPSGLSGWVSINNHSGADYEDARLKLVAGVVNRVRPEPMRARARAISADMVAVAAAPAPPEFAQSAMFEYYLYDLQRPTTIRNNQTKQINLMEAQGLKVEKEYISQQMVTVYPMHGGSAITQSVDTYFKFRNTKENKLGDPLPAGAIRVYTTDDRGRRQFLGEDQIRHTPRDEEIRLNAGKALDIVVERTQLNFTQRTSRQTETDWQISVRNRKAEDVTVRLQETAGGQWEIRESSHKHEKVDAYSFRFDVPVKKGQEAVVKYKIRFDR